MSVIKQGGSQASTVQPGDPASGAQEAGPQEAAEGQGFFLHTCKHGHPESHDRGGPATQHRHGWQTQAHCPHTGKPAPRPPGPGSSSCAQNDSRPHRAALSVGPRGFLRRPRPGHIIVFPKQKETQPWGAGPPPRQERASPMQHLEPGPALPGSSPSDRAGQPRVLNKGKSGRPTFYHIRAPSTDRCLPVLSAQPTGRCLACGQQGGRPAATASRIQCHQLAGPQWPSASPTHTMAPRPSSKSVELGLQTPPPSSPLTQEWCRGVGTGSQ